MALAKMTTAQAVKQWKVHKQAWTDEAVDTYRTSRDAGRTRSEAQDDADNALFDWRNDWDEMPRASAFALLADPDARREVLQGLDDIVDMESNGGSENIADTMGSLGIVSDDTGSDMLSRLLCLGMRTFLHGHGMRALDRIGKKPRG